MKEKIIFIFLISLSSLSKIAQAQTIFWQENFGSGCSQGNLANQSAPTPSNGTWNITNIGAQGAVSNDWFISATESGLPIGQCGDGCISTPSLTNRTLHISSNIPPPNLDPNAVYLQNASSTTNKRVQSQLINCSLQSNIVFSFKYLSKGMPGADFAEVLFSENGGGAWQVLGILAPSTGTCPSKGLWANQSYTLPATADGNTNVKIAFRWENLNSVGPGNISVAIDEITLSGTLSTSIEKRDLNKEIKLFPNPVKDNMTLLLDESVVSKINITNYLGQIVYTLNSPLSKQEIDLSFLTSGVYLLNILGSNSLTVYKKFVIVR
jgi:hypothetical protein